MISTKHSHNMMNTENRRKQVKIKPQSVHDYNMNMGGVDNSDQFLLYYNFQRKTIRWYKKVFLHILELAVTNAYLVYKEAVKRPKLPFLKFRDSFIEELTCYKEDVPKLPTASKAVSDNLVVPEFDRIEEFHCLENIGSNSSKSVFLRCRVCTLLKKRKETRVRCRDCPEKPPLCPAPCFAIFHGH